MRALLPPGGGIVVLDSDHHERHVLEEGAAALPRVRSAGQYLVAEDTNINGHPVLPRYGRGPLEAVNRFLEEDREFVRQTMRFGPPALFVSPVWLAEASF